MFAPTALACDLRALHPPRASRPGAASLLPNPSPVAPLPICVTYDTRELARRTCTLLCSPVLREDIDSSGHNRYVQVSIKVDTFHHREHARRAIIESSMKRKQRRRGILDTVPYRDSAGIVYRNRASLEIKLGS